MRIIIPLIFIMKSQFFVPILCIFVPDSKEWYSYVGNFFVIMYLKTIFQCFYRISSVYIAA